MFYSANENQLIAFGYQLGQRLKANDLIVLTGDLGSGKTTLTKGIAKGLGIDQMIKSPTYTIVREYEGRLPLYHLDVYRIGDDPDSIDLDDFIYNDGVTVIEWGELLGDDILEDYLELIISRCEQGRSIECKAHGNAYHNLMMELEDAER
ncbi:tRNA (adenosine(37)-N6)-threonylcarbamoyltransferase complex ATPase subunit type 1 TsaE [Streptococcus iniae]|uniref:tRNA threonylcarbamoyladenosine biosynthesis protein TsaE n=1 Tax=Streptococcus iniae TaxID=1346 RepID=A0A3L8GF50_STRIN|nr:tRNA (adenosine(37)-N6)-threonylcarbamoyltransferase complex ATPase subunit type 1 TsaE [Streptococcus iniae]AHY16409.1 hydrolase [Streptococcus iniae]AHY18271.1 hydrolase [Streptococcus iniae]AJG26962.1 hydrolase [Streptococcus iniae]AYB02714.1 tRNA (adenosine(37)-N6)-threonylcarbamoyltransferase complex ATPase subunit type 1 TsaE [Streptococcus iniae]AYB04583.1 tRNA (adenosine(37)-N6)-threonylcarbamoyltransferase complex ATPase subunit type 1 TsaE [Streptococcus iniae]